MRKSVYFIFILLSFILIATITSFSYSISRTEGAVNANFTKIDNALNFISNFDEKFSKSNNSFKISSRYVNESNMINVNSFCSLTDCGVAGNSIRRGDFTFFLMVDDYIVQLINGVLYANLYVMSEDLGLNCYLGNDVYVITPKYLKQRILLKDNNVKDYYGAKDVVKIDDLTILQYETEYKTHLAYCKFIENEIDVQLDGMVSTVGTPTYDDTIIGDVQPTTWDGVMMGFDKYNEYLNEISKTQKLNDIVVVVVDTGINESHELFQGRLLMEYAKDFTKSHTGLKDEYGHGTQIAGVIAKWTPSNVKILPIRFFDKFGNSNWSTLLLICKYLDELINSGVNIKVVNCSLLNYTNENTLNWGTTREAKLWGEFKKFPQKDIAVCCAAGNDSRSATKAMPAGFKELITVSALAKNNELASYSNYDCIDFCAPADGVVSASEKNNNRYELSGGTSVATPHISTAFALLFSDPIKNYTLSQAYDICSTICAVDLGVPGLDNKFGYGYIDLSNLFIENKKGDFNEYNICFSVVAKDKNRFYTDIGAYEFKYIDEYNSVISKRFVAFGSWDYIIKTSSSIYLRGASSVEYSFVGWYLGNCRDCEKAEFISNSEFYILPIDKLTSEWNYIYAVVDINYVDISINFMYKDVEDYSGFASYGLNCSAESALKLGGSYKKSLFLFNVDMFAENQVLNFKCIKSRAFKFSISCENDSVINKIVYLTDSPYAISGPMREYNGNYQYANVYDDTNRIDIVVLVLI